MVFDQILDWGCRTIYYRFNILTKTYTGILRAAHKLDSNCQYQALYRLKYSPDLT